jgi:hypothetical protein
MMSDILRDFVHKLITIYLSRRRLCLQPKAPTGGATAAAAEGVRS